MNTYTSYFAKVRSMPRDVTKIVISRYKPSFDVGFSYEHMPDLAPSVSTLHEYKQTGDLAQLKRKYYAELTTRGKSALTKLMVRIACGETLVLLCFEKEPESCHRSVLAEVLRSKGIEVEEYIDGFDDMAPELEEEESVVNFDADAFLKDIDLDLF